MFHVEIGPGGKAGVKSKGRRPSQDKKAKLRNGEGATSVSIPTEEEMSLARELLNSAHSYYSYVSDNGTRHVKRRKRRDDGTYSDSESCDEDMMERYKEIKKAKVILGDEVEEIRQRHFKKKRKEAEEEEHRRRPSIMPTQGAVPVDEDEHPRSFSVHSEVSEGGTRRRYKRKVLRDDEGNVIGYGSPEPYMSSGESDGGLSIRIRRGSLSEDDDDDEARNASKKQLRRLQKMIERPQRRQGPPREGQPKKKTWTDEYLEGIPLKQKPGHKTTAHGEDKPIDLQALDMPTAGPTTRRMSEMEPDAEAEYFSDSTDEEPDLSAMTEEERAEYLDARDKRRHERELRMRAKFGDKYDEMRRKKKEQKDADARSKLDVEGAETAESTAGDALGRPSGPKRDSVSLQAKLKEKPKSMVSYEKGPAREVGGSIEKTDSRDIGPSHTDWTRRPTKTKEVQKKTRDDSHLFNFQPSKMAAINLNRMLEREEKQAAKAKQKRGAVHEEDGADESKRKTTGDIAEEAMLEGFEVGEDGQLKVKDGMEIDINRITSAILRKLGIDPGLSKEEIVRLLQEKLGDKVVLRDGLFQLGNKSITALNLSTMTDEMIAEDPNLDVNTMKGPRRVNVLMIRGGQLLREHLRRVIDMCALARTQDYATDLDETDSSIDFLSHYRLVDPEQIEAYARAFVVEDRDLDTVITFLETQTALEGVPTIQHMTCKQMHYVLKVLDIDDASQVTFRMFAVITALCERVTLMDSLSKHLLEICNLADIERKVDLYQAMFYHNVPSDRQSNFITNESLKIELIAGGLNWKQQQYVMEKMEPNSWGDISFLDYMCYIPLFMSMHDNICDNPLDMSDDKYVMPPRKRPPSAQRDMNPLGYHLSKISSFLMKRQARDLKEGRLDPTCLSDEHLATLKNYSKLSNIDSFDKPAVDEEETTTKMDLIY